MDFQIILEILTVQVGWSRKMTVENKILLLSREFSLNHPARQKNKEEDFFKSVCE